MVLLLSIPFIIFALAKHKHRGSYGGRGFGLYQDHSFQTLGKYKESFGIKQEIHLFFAKNFLGICQDRPGKPLEKHKGSMETSKESEVKKRLKEFMASVGMSANKFCITAGIDTTTFSRMSQDVNAATLTAIAKTFPQLDIRYILTGEKTDVPTERSTGIRLLPFDAVAGHLSGNLNGDYSETIQLPQLLARGADFAIRVEGDSMTPRFQSGELLLAKRVDDSFIQWGKCYVVATKHDCVVKRLYPCKDDDNSVTCHSENTESYPDYDIRKEDITGIGIVVGHIGHD